MDEILFLLFTSLLGTVTGSPTPGVKYTFYSVRKTWNEARAICESQRQVMLKLDTQEKFNNFLDIWMSSGVKGGDLWTGLHRHIITNYSTYNLEWYDCEPLFISEWIKWANSILNERDTELCIRLATSYVFHTRECNTAYQLVCQHNTVCSYDEFQNKTVVDVTLASTFDDTLEGCKQFCLDFSDGSDECVIITYSGNLYGVCKIYKGSSVFVQNQPNMTEEQGTRVLIKRCVFGEDHSTAPSVEANTASEPITECPASAETSAIPSSSMSSHIISSTASTLNIYTENIQQTDMTTDNLDQQSLFDESFSSELGSVHLTQLSQSKEYFTSSDEQIETSVVSLLYSNKNVVALSEAVVTESMPVQTTPPLQYDTDTPLSLVSLSSLNNVHELIPSLNSNTILDMTDLESIVGSSVMGSILPTLSPQGSRWTASDDFHSSAYVVLPDSTVNILPSSLAIEETTRLQTTLIYQNGTTTNSLCPCFCAIKNPDVSVMYISVKNLLDKKNVSSYWRSKNSAQDDRMSAQAIGSSGIVIISFVVFIIVCMDLDKLLRANKRRKK